jgi:peptidoglycan/LPS O-acetylase OafA/YrhL
MRRWAPRQRIAFFLLLTALFFAFCFLISAARVRLSMFAAGILLYETMQSTDIPKKLTLRLETLGVSFFGLSFLALGLIYERYRVVSWLPGFEYASGTHRVLLMFFSFYVFALFCFAFDGVTNRILRWTPMRWLGNISYSFYLIHGLTLVAVSEVSHRIIPPSGHSPWLVLGFLCVGFAATVASATLLFVLVEKPCSLTSKPKSL